MSSLVTRGLGEPSALVTRGLGAGVRTPTGGGVVIDEAEALLVDIETIQELVAAVEEALAPVADLLPVETETDVTVAHAPVAVLDASHAAVAEISTAEEEIDALQATESQAVDVSTAEAAAAVLSTGETDVADLTASESPAATIEPDEANAGE